jgi:hypothetical protein
MSLKLQRFGKTDKNDTPQARRPALTGYGAMLLIASELEAITHPKYTILRRGFLVDCLIRDDALMVYIVA